MQCSRPSSSVDNVRLKQNMQAAARLTPLWSVQMVPTREEGAQ